MRALLFVVTVSACGQIQPDECDAGEPVLCVEMGKIEVPGRTPYMQTGLQFCSGGRYQVFACSGAVGCVQGICAMHELDAGAPCPPELEQTLSDCAGPRALKVCRGGVLAVVECADRTACVASSDGATCR